MDLRQLCDIPYGDGYLDGFVCVELFSQFWVEESGGIFAQVKDRSSEIYLYSKDALVLQAMKQLPIGQVIVIGKCRYEFFNTSISPEKQLVLDRSSYVSVDHSVVSKWKNYADVVHGMDFLYMEHKLTF